MVKQINRSNLLKDIPRSKERPQRRNSITSTDISREYPETTPYAPSIQKLDTDTLTEILKTLVAQGQYKTMTSLASTCKGFWNTYQEAPKDVLIPQRFSLQHLENPSFLKLSEKYSHEEILEQLEITFQKAKNNNIPISNKGFQKALIYHIVAGCDKDKEKRKNILGQDLHKELIQNISIHQPDLLIDVYLQKLQHQNEDPDNYGVKVSGSLSDYEKNAIQTALLGHLEDKKETEFSSQVLSQYKKDKEAGAAKLHLYSSQIKNLLERKIKEQENLKAFSNLPFPHDI